MFGFSLRRFGKAKFALHSLSDALGCFKKAAKLRGVEDAEIKRQIDLVSLKSLFNVVDWCCDGVSTP